MRDLECIVVHHSASARDTRTDTISSWHTARKWDGIGYHFVIEEDGSIHAGRPLDRAGAHVHGHNAYSIGVCVTGDNTKEGRKWNERQKRKLLLLLSSLRTVFGYMAVKRHSDFAATHCPGLTDGEWYDLTRPINIVG